MQPEIVFLKLGGSLITQKNQEHTAQIEVIARLAAEIARAAAQKPSLRILLGHGSGSFGHFAAAKHGTRAGVHSPQDWLGFAEVWREARALNQIVMAALHQAGLPAVAFPPSAWLIANDDRLDPPETRPLTLALEHGLLPVVQGDVAFDILNGGTILSTEDVFSALVVPLKPDRILLAGVDEGVWADFPICAHLLDEIHADSYSEPPGSLQGSANTDVTGGMREKVLRMVAITQSHPTITSRIFSGVQPENLFRVLLGEPIGTFIHS